MKITSRHIARPLRHFLRVLTSEHLQPIQLRVVFLKALTVNYERARDDGLLFIFGPDNREITFVASKVAVVSFPSALDVVSKK